MIVYCDRDDCKHWKEGECNNKTIYGTAMISIGTDDSLYNDKPICTDYEEKE